MITVYLVDDHAIVRDGLRAVLEAHQDIHVVGDAASGHQALPELQELRPDVVIMDVWMPGEDGCDIARSILAANPDNRVIFLSMLGTPEHVHRALRAGASGYLLKESAGREVVMAVQAVAAGTQYYSQSIADLLVAHFVQDDAAGSRGPLASLSERERQVLQMVLEGLSSVEIGQRLHLSSKTVETYRSRMMQKLGVSGVAELTRLAVQLGLIPLE